MNNTYKAIIGGVLLAGGIYYFVKKKPVASLSAPKADNLDVEVGNAMARFSEASPLGITGGIAPDKAQVARGAAYLKLHLTPIQKAMFVEYANKFMTGTEKWATSNMDEKSLDEQKATDAFMEILTNIQRDLEKEYGVAEADKFMLFMNNFDPKKV